ncbi:MAG: hypothetical protein Q9207_005188 [Kuettlingeria erythrocarpa]
MTENILSDRQWRPIALVPVGLNEAALDSPTFRSSVSYFAEQVEIIEKWLDTWLKSVVRMTQEAGALESIINGSLSQIVPPANVSEAVIDHDYTLLALKSYGEGARDLWTSTTSGMRKMEANVVEPESRRVLEQTQKAFDGLLSRYSAQTKIKEPSSLREDAFSLHEARKAYLKASMDFSVAAPQLRTTLDKVLVRVISDQWRDMRRSPGPASNARRKWNDNIERVRCWSREVENGEAAFRRNLQSARKQIEDSTEARSRPSRELEDYASSASLSSGSRAIATTDLQNRVDEGGPQAEKQGWLFLRTLSGKPTRTVWVRRWFFVKNGIFGWLVQGSRSGGVEESDRIGVLLCNVRPAPSEERRFTFEVKTKDLSVVLQAESQGELVGWMKAFETAKKQALEDPSSTDSPGLEGPSQDPAFAISSPPAPEFAASAADSGLHQFREDSSSNTGTERGSTLPVPAGDAGFALPGRSSTDIGSHRRSTVVDRDGESGAARIIQKLDIHRKSMAGNQPNSNPGGPSPSSPALAGGGIASLIAASHTVMPVGPGIPQPPMDASAQSVGGSRKPLDLPSTSIAPNTLVNVPAPTSLSATAVLVSGERGIGLGRTDATGGQPSGVMANVWGSSNWGYLNRLQRGEVRIPQLGPSSDPSKAGSSAAIHRKTSSLPSGVSTVTSPGIKSMEYQGSSPVQLRTQDAQFRLLFPNVSRAESVVLVFQATWSLNEQQEFPGRVYVTNKHIYFYSHHLGLVLTSGIALDSIIEVTAAPGRDYDLIFIHLREALDNTSLTRVTVKTFLEPLRLLEQRLNFLVESCNATHPSDAETIIKDLLKMDQSHSTSSPTKEHFEDFTATATSDEGRVRGKSRDLRAAVMFDGKLYGNTQSESRDMGKIKLPRQPVLYVPAGMDRAVVDKLFDISSKALFHVLFGDKSAVWQLLYHERHAQRRVRSATVTDYQMIDVLNDHLCYVVTDRKSPWHLPHGIITKRALTDMEINALDLSDLITDQVQRLGAQSRTHKAIQIFGQVGVQAQALEFGGSDAPITTRARRSMKRRTLARLLLDSVHSFVQRVLTAILDRLFALVRWAWKTMNANMIILAILGSSLLANAIFSSNGTAQWWKDRQARSYLAILGIGSEQMMSKAIYLRDMDDAWSPHFGTIEASDNACRETFEGYLSSADVKTPQVSAHAAHSASQAAVRRLQRSRERLGSQRHDLIVALRVINSIEQEMVEAEWEEWLYGETAKCKQMERVLGEEHTGSPNSKQRSGIGKQASLGTKRADWAQVRLWHENYCGSCYGEERSLVKKQAGREG